MSKKHFVALAQALAENRPNMNIGNEAPDEYSNEQITANYWQWDQWRAIRASIAGICAEENPLFDRPKFIKATEV